MDPVLVALLVCVITAALAGILFLRRDATPSGVGAAEAAAAVAAVAAAEAHGGGLRRGDDGGESSEEEEEKEEEQGGGAARNRFEKRRLEKQREKEQRAREREAVVEERRRRKLAEDARAADERDAERAAEEAEEAALQQLRREKAAREDDEYRQWAGHIEVEEKGIVEADETRTGRLRAALLAAAAPRGEKVVVLEVMARRFGMTVDALVAEINALLKAGDIAGVFDDRGKFLCVADGEFCAVARFIRNRGRVSVSELVRECNRVLSDA